MNIEILSHRTAEGLSLRNTSTYLDLLLDVIRTTDSENWDYFAISDKELALSFLEYASLSRVIVNREDDHAIPLAYVALTTLRPEAPFLLKNDFYSTLSIPFESLLEPLNRITKESALYIDVISIKENYQGRPVVMKAIVEALYDIINELDINNLLPKFTYAVAVTPGGNKMCKLIATGESKDGISSVNREVVNDDKVVAISDRTLYEFKTEELLEKLKRLIK